VIGPSISTEGMIVAKVWMSSSGGGGVLVQPEPVGAMDVDGMMAGAPASVAASRQ
jgi:hypothetical protein